LQTFLQKNSVFVTPMIKFSISSFSSPITLKLNQYLCLNATNALLMALV